MKRKFEEIEVQEVSRKRLKKELKIILKKENNEVKGFRRKIRRKLEGQLSLAPKALDPRKQEIKELILKIKQKLEKKASKNSEKVLGSKAVNTLTPAAPAKSESVPTPTPEKAKSTTATSTTLKSPKSKSEEPQKISADILKWRAENNVTVQDTEQKAPRQDFKFVDAKYLEPWKNYKKPTPIQAQSWPYSLEGRDVVGIAETGSGKTLAFIWPTIKRHLENPRAKNGQVGALILAPTRELAMQIQKQIEAFGGPFGCKSTCIYGGVPKWQQKNELREGKDIVVGTPGRLLAMVRYGELDLSKVDYVVLDEADRMLEQGFVPDVTELIAACQPKGKRQTMLFSATWPIEVEKLGKSFMTNPVKITVQKSETELSVVSTVSQEIRVMKKWDREDALWELLTKLKGKKLIVFCLYKKETANLAYSVNDWGFKNVSLHGNMDQRQRSISMKAFRDNEARILVATDVASRGLDVSDIDYVINFSFPLTIEDYVHRIGRTGRAGKSGKSITFFTEADKLCARDLVEILEKAEENVPKELLKLRCARRCKRRGYY